MVTSFRNFSTSPSGSSFLCCDSLTLTGAHSLFPNGMTSIVRSPVLQHPWDGPAIPCENLDQLICDLVALVYFPVSLVDIFLIPEIFFLTFNFPLIHPCHLEPVNIGSSASCCLPCGQLGTLFNHVIWTICCTDFFKFL